MNKRAGLFVQIPVALALLLLLSGNVWAVEVGKVVRLEGKADARHDNRELRVLRAGDAVFDKDVIRTKSGSVLELAMIDGSRLTLAENTRLDITEYEIEENPRSLLKMTQGKIRAFVTELFSVRKDSFVTKTPTAVVGVQGTEFDVEAQQQETSVFVLNGVVNVTNIDANVKGTLILYPGEAGVVRSGQAPVPVNVLTGAEGEDATRIYTDIGSGSRRDMISSGIQTDDPNNTVPTVPSAITLPQDPNTP